MNKAYALTKIDALLITDMQIDFLPGGALPVSNADKLIPAINDYISRFEEANAPVFASRDWHPPNHMSFKPQGGPWPPHCIQNTLGSTFSPLLNLQKNTVIISKAVDSKLEAYSAFDQTNLMDELIKFGAKRLFVAGVATDYCVVNTVLDSIKLGFETIVLMDAVAGIDAKAGDVNTAIDTMLKSGAKQATILEFLSIEDKLPLEQEFSETLAEKPARRAEKKLHARFKSKGVSRRIRTEH